jgi:hypothetical protein
MTRFGANRSEEKRSDANQAGEAEAKTTKWPPLGNKAAVNQLDEKRGSEAAAKTATGTSGASEVPATNGGPRPAYGRLAAFQSTTACSTSVLNVLAYHSKCCTDCIM